MDLFISISILILLIITSAIVSAAEISLAGSRKTKLQYLAKNGDNRAIKVLKLQESPGRFITIVQIVLNMVAILGGSIGESAIRVHIEQVLAIFHLNSDWVLYATSVISFLLITVMFVMFADLLPKRFAMIQPEKVAVRTVNIMLFFMLIFKPLVWILDAFSNGIFKLLNIPTNRQEKVTSDDIYAVVNAAVSQGILKKQESYLIENIFDMQERRITSIMTTREYIVYLNLNDDREKILNTLSNNTHTNIPICTDSLDSVIGYIESHTLLTYFLNNQQDIALNDPKILRKALFIPDTLSLYDVLEMFKSTGEDFAIIVNEYAIVVGIVTLKDVMSIVMGELVLIEEEQIVPRDENSWLIDGSTPLEDVMRVLEIDQFPQAENYETLSGFMMFSLKKIPKKTDYLIYQNYKFEVINTENFKIHQLLVSKLKEE